MLDIAGNDMEEASSLQNRSYLVTGGAGFIGSHLCDALVRLGARVTVVDDFSTGRRENLNSKAALYEMSINDERLTEVFEKVKPTHIFHLAFNTSVPKSVENPLVEQDSIIGSIRLFELALKFGVQKVVFSSSEFIYGNSAPRPTLESASMEPLAPYAISKSCIENYLLYYFKERRLPAVILRYATVYGPRQRMGAMTDYIRKLSRGAQAEIWGDGTKTREYIYVDDVVHATLLALKVPNEHPLPIFNLGSGRETTLLELYSKIAAFLDKEPKPIFLEDRPGEQVRCLLDSNKIKSQLDWVPRISLEEGLKLRINDFLAYPC